MEIIPENSEGSRMTTLTTFLDHEIIKSSLKITAEELRHDMDNVKI